MGFLDPNAPDVFVSYAHGPVPLGKLGGGRIDPLGKWTRALVANVSKQVDFHLGIKDPTQRAILWMDPELEGNLPLTANVRAKVEQSALMLLVMSPFYLQSHWCGQEVGWFTAGGRDRTAEGNLFVIRVVPTDEEKWPATLRDEQVATLRGYRFHPAKRPGEICEPLGWPEPTIDDGDYMHQVDQLAHDIAKRLTKLRWVKEQASQGEVARRQTSGPALQQVSSSRGSETPDVFISYAREDRARVAMIVNRLSAEGCSIFWDKNIPPGRTWDNYIGRALEAARCVIVVWSKISVQSDYVKEEAEDARERGCYIPIGLHGAKAPFGFRRYQVADFTNWISIQNDEEIEPFLNELRLVLTRS